MEAINDFWPHHHYLNTYAKAVVFPHDISEDDGNADFFITLKDGSTYSFTAFTPENMRAYMQQEQTNFFMAPGMIIVHTINAVCILEAVEECLKRAVTGNNPLTHYGVLQ